MKITSRRVLLALGTTFFILPLAVLATDTEVKKICESTDSKDTPCTLHVDKLHPTQFAVGGVAVACKAEKISKKPHKKLKKYLEKPDKYIPVVIGPDGNFYMTDHHHLATALFQAKSTATEEHKQWNYNDKILHIDILDNHSIKEPLISMDEFWKNMHKDNNIYNYDNKGTPYMNFALLPKHVGKLLNDPYRTLSRWVRESCGYVKSGKEQCDNIRPEPAHDAPYFMEFYWGDFFRKHYPISDKTGICQSIPYSKLCLNDEIAKLKGIYQESMKLAASEQAKKHFEDLNLKPLKYGYNPSGQSLPIKWTGGCEEVTPNG